MGVVYMHHYMKIVTVIANTVYLPFEMMEAATNYIREDAKNGDFDHDAIDALCDYWIQCIKWERRFGER